MISKLKNLQWKNPGMGAWAAFTLAIASFAVVLPNRSPKLDGQKLGVLSATINRLEGACSEFRKDTGHFPLEYTAYAASSRDLTEGHGIPGWRGPYLPEPLAHGRSNPFGSLHLYNNLSANSWIDGFDLDGDGIIDRRDGGNMLWLSGIRPAVAEWLNSWLDVGESNGWRRRGRVRYDTRRQFCWVLLNP